LGRQLITASKSVGGSDGSKEVRMMEGSMKGMRIFTAILASVFFVVGYWMSGRFEEEFGRTLFLAGSILTSGILISSAILEGSKE
jgi:hypothetical protein